MIKIDSSLYHLVRQPEVETANPPLLILLHGVGSNEHDLFGLASYLDERFLILSARAPNTLQGYGIAGGSYAWFHVQFISGVPSINPDEAEESRKIIIGFVKEATRTYNVNPSQVYLMGFSQGAIMSFSVMLTEPQLLAGIVAMSGRILPEVKSRAVSPERLSDFPVMVVHGLYDQVLPVRNGRESREYLSTLPVTLDYREYPMGHEVSERSLADVRQWLSAQLDAKEAQNDTKAHARAKRG